MRKTIQVSPAIKDQIQYLKFTLDLSNESEVIEKLIEVYHFSNGASALLFQELVKKIKEIQE